MSYSCSGTKWLLDSGATYHICSDISYFSEYKSIKSDNFITIPDGIVESLSNTLAYFNYMMTLFYEMFFMYHNSSSTWSLCINCVKIYIVSCISLMIIAIYRLRKGDWLLLVGCLLVSTLFQTRRILKLLLLN